MRDDIVFMDVNGSEVTLFTPKNADRFNYYSLKLLPNHVEIDGTNYKIRHYNRNYLLDKLKDKDLGTMTISTDKFKLTFSLIYPIVYVEKNGAKYSFSYSTVRVYKNYLVFDLGMYKKTYDIKLTEMEKLYICDADNSTYLRTDDVEFDGHCLKLFNTTYNLKPYLTTVDKLLLLLNKNKLGSVVANVITRLRGKRRYRMMVDEDGFIAYIYKDLIFGAIGTYIIGDEH